MSTIEETTDPQERETTLEEEIAIVKRMLILSPIKEARARAEAMLARWPDSPEAQHVARLASPPVVKAVPGSGLSVEKEGLWLEANARNYSGCWLAVSGDRLVAADPDYERVRAIVKEDPENPQVVLYYSSPRRSR